MKYLARVYDSEGMVRNHRILYSLVTAMRFNTLGEIEEQKKKEQDCGIYLRYAVYERNENGGWTPLYDERNLDEVPY